MSGWRIWPVGLLMIAFITTSLRLWQIDYPPLIDWPNHLARHAIQCGDETFGRLGAYYTFELPAFPYLAADFLHMLPMACADIFLTQKILVQFAILGLILSAFALHYAIWRRLSVWPGAVALVAFNMNLGYGFENYVLTAPLAIALLALWVAMDKATVWLRLAVIAPLGFGLYFCHLYAFAFFGIMLAALETRTAWHGWRAKAAPRGAVLARLLGAAMTGLLPVLHVLLILSEGAPRSIQETDFGGVMSRFVAATSLTSSQILAGLDRFARIESILALFVLLLLPLFVKAIGGKLAFHPTFRWAAVASLLLFALMPSVLATVYFTHIRFPVLIVVVLVAATDLRLSPAREIGLALCLMAGFLARTEAALPQWRAHEVQVQELLDATAGLGPAHRLLAARNGLDGQIVRHSHSVSYVSMHHGVLAPTLFNGANPLTANPTISSHSILSFFPKDRIELLQDLHNAEVNEGDSPRATWPQFFTHLILFKTRDGTTSGVIPEFGRLLVSGSFFDLYALPVSEGNIN